MRRTKKKRGQRQISIGAKKERKRSIAKNTCGKGGEVNLQGKERVRAIKGERTRGGGLGKQKRDT